MVNVEGNARARGSTGDGAGKIATHIPKKGMSRQHNEAAKSRMCYGT